MWQEAVPSRVLPSRVLPSRVLPGGVVPSRAVPSRAVPRLVSARAEGAEFTAPTQNANIDSRESPGYRAPLRVHLGRRDEVDVAALDHDLPPLAVHVVMAAGAQHHAIREVRATTRLPPTNVVSLAMLRRRVALGTTAVAF